MIRIDRKISLTWVLTLLIQFVAIIAWATYLEARVKNLETSTQPMTALFERFARLEERIDYLRADVAEIKSNIQKVARFPHEEK